MEAANDGQTDSEELPLARGAAGLERIWPCRRASRVAQILRWGAVAFLVLAASVAAALSQLRAPPPPTPTPEPVSSLGGHSILKDYEPIDAQAMGECVGSIMAVGLWTANVGLIIRAAIYDCPINKRFGSTYEKNDPWYPNGTIKPEYLQYAGGLDGLQDPRRLQEIDAANPETREALMRMMRAKHRALEDLHNANISLTESFHKFLGQQHADLRAMCARDALELVSASAIIAEYIEGAEEACAGQAFQNEDCAVAVTGLVNKIPRTARFATQMEIRCPKRSSDFNPANSFRPDASYDCEGRMEGVSWELSTIGAKVQKAISFCGPKKTKVPKPDIGGCVTMIISSASYLGASAIALDSAGSFNCKNVTKYDLALAYEAAKGDDDAYDELVNSRYGRGLQCAVEITSAIRTMGISSMQATKAAEYCGTLKNRCGRSIAGAAAAFSGAVESFILAAEYCQLKPIHDEGDIKERNIECTAYSASAMKEMSVTAAMSFDASNACQNMNSAAGVCAASISKALAAFGYMIERTSLAGKNCQTPDVKSGKKAYACGQNLEQAGEAVIIVSTAIGTAAINCGLGMKPSPTKHFGLNRRFWVPR